jgi:hypothetical protein
MTVSAMSQGSKSCERALFGHGRDLFVRIVMLGVVLGSLFDVFHGMDQVAMGNHGMMRRLVEVPCSVILSGTALMFGGVLQKFGGLQMMIDAFLRHDLE